MKATILHLNAIIACVLLAFIQVATLAILGLLAWHDGDIGGLLKAVGQNTGSVEILAGILFAPTAGIVWVAKYFSQRPAEVHNNGIEVAKTA